MIIPRCLEPLWRVCPKDDSARYSLRAIRAERSADSKPSLIVTDSRVLIVAEFDEPELTGPAKSPEPRPKFAANIPADLYRMAFAASRWHCDGAGGYRPLVLSEDAGKPAIAYTANGSIGLEATAPADVGTFPLWQTLVNRPMPELVDKQANADRCVAVSFSPAVLEKFCAVLSRMGMDQVTLHVPVDPLNRQAWYQAKSSEHPGVKIKALLAPLI